LSFELAKITRCIDFYEGVGIPGRFESESDIGFLDLVMNLQEGLFEIVLIDTYTPTE
jgi:hypothetical protein